MPPFPRCFFIFFFFFGVDVDACVSPRGTKKILAPRRKKKKRTKNDDFDASSVSCVGTKKLFTNKRQAGSKSLFCGNDSDGKRRKNQLTQGRFPHLSTLFFHKSFKFMSQESSVGKQTSISISTLSLCTLGFSFSSLGGKSVKPSLSPLAGGF